MQLETLDWLIIASYFVLSALIGIAYSKQAGKSLESFFLGGRSLPWHIAGISMVATTFAADTPLAVTELVVNQGIAGNWLWWNFLAGGMLTTFFFARLWYKSGVVTEAELIELRYSGKEAAFLRGFKAVYLGLFMNGIIIAWVNIALVSILKVFFGIDHSTALLITAGAMLLTALYASLSGLLGVAFTDVVQFVIAMVGCIVLAYIVVNSSDIGGIAGLKAKLGDVSPQALHFLPTIGDGQPIGKSLGIGVLAFFSYAGVQWWASWYPGAEPGGGGYIAQRLMSTRSEKDAVYATLFFQIAHYCIRPWPWILVGLCAIVLYPELPKDDVKLGYVYAMRDYLPVGLKGLLLVAFFAAYMSTISTQLNWGASYVVNDLYKRFWEPMASEQQLVRISRVVTVLMMLLGLAITTQINSISGAWGFIMQCGAGLGLVLILRWYWWRINAYSEIAATIAPFVFTALCSLAGLEFPEGFLLTVLGTTITWLVVTFLTPPTQTSVLTAFYNKVQPDGNWSGVANASAKMNSSNMMNLFICWLSAITFTYSTLFMTGKLVLQMWAQAGIAFALALGSLIILRHFISKTNLFA